MSEENTIAPIVEDEVFVDDNQGEQYEDEQDVDIDLDLDVDFDDELTLDDIEGYNPDNEEIVAYVGQLQEEAQAQGFTVEQTKWLIAKSLAGYTEKEEEPKERTIEEVKQHLKETLTPSELRSYNTTKNFVANQLRGTEYEGAIGEIVQNGHLMKIFNAIRERGNRGIQNAPVKQPTPTQKFEIPVEQALEGYSRFVATEGKNEDFAERKQQFFNSLFNNANNSEELKAIFKSYL